MPENTSTTPHQRRGPLVIYHGGGCRDGFTAAWLLWRVYGEHAEYRPAQYGDTPPTDAEVKDREVYIVDFSYERDALTRISDHALEITVLDHHKSAVANLKGWEPAGSGLMVLDENNSGAGLMLNELAPEFRDREVDGLVAYVEDRDLWRFDLRNSRAINAVLQSVPMTFERWDTLSNELFCDTAEIVRSGELLLEAQAHRVERAVKHAATRRLAFPSGLLSEPVPVLNVTTDISETVGAMAEVEGVPFAIGYFETETHRVYSLRSRGDDGANVAAIAQEFGGGGHEHAAGFRVPLVAAWAVFRGGYEPEEPAGNLGGGA